MLTGSGRKGDSEGLVEALKVAASEKANPAVVAGRPRVWGKAFRGQDTEAGKGHRDQILLPGRSLWKNSKGR